jgi:hypothetical protein
MFVLEIAGTAVQYGPSLKDLTLLDDPMLMLRGCWHSWVLIDENKRRYFLNENIDNISHCSDQTYEVDYYDGLRNNKLLIQNGMCKPLQEVHVNGPKARRPASRGLQF